MVRPVPYFSQWESPEYVEQFVKKTLSPEDDPLWAQSGAESSEEYALWSPHICGMACLKMILAHRFDRNVPTMTLLADAIREGVYQPEKGDGGKRLFYRPFVRMMHDRFSIDAKVVENIVASHVTAMIEEGGLFMASVHPSIRAPEGLPPSKGGHLVLVFASDTGRNGLVFHNPSGFTLATQQNVALSEAVFDRFFAGRGIYICAPSSK